MTRPTDLSQDTRIGNSCGYFIISIEQAALDQNTTFRTKPVHSQNSIRQQKNTVR